MMIADFSYHFTRRRLTLLLPDKPECFLKPPAADEPLEGSITDALLRPYFLHARLHAVFSPCISNK